MSPYRIRRESDEASEIRRIAYELVDDAVGCLRDEDADPVKAVHEARKDSKKLRALLRIVRPVIGEKAYSRENQRFRDAGRRLSDARDAQVRAATIDALADRFANDPPAGGWAALRSALAGRGPARDDLARVRARAADAFAEGGAQVNEWPLGGNGFALIRRGLKRAYAQGRKRYRAARADPTDEKLHEWRKRAKDLWYHLRLVNEGWPELLGAAADEADELSDRLGDDHDLAVLGTDLDGEPRALAPAQLEHLAKLIAIRRDELQREAFAYGERLYAEKPKRFVRRLERYWSGSKP